MRGYRKRELFDAVIAIGQSNSVAASLTAMNVSSFKSLIPPLPPSGN